MSGWGRCLHPGQCTPVPAQPARRPLPGGWALLVPLWHSQCRCLPAGCPIATLSFSTRMWLCLQGWTSPCLPHCRCTMRNMPVCMYSIHQPSPPPHPTPPHPTPPHPTPSPPALQVHDEEHGVDHWVTLEGQPIKFGEMHVSFCHIFLCDNCLCNTCLVSSEWCCVRCAAAAMPGWLAGWLTRHACPRCQPLQTFVCSNCLHACLRCHQPPAVCRLLPPAACLPAGG